MTLAMPCEVVDWADGQYSCMSAKESATGYP